MPGLNLSTGIGAYAGPSYGGYSPAATPAAAGASPQGPSTIGAKAFGITTGGSGGMYSCAHIGLISAGTLSLAGLLFIYWSLPR
jgi:hypothetical protein